MKYENWLVKETLNNHNSPSKAGLIVKALKGLTDTPMTFMEVCGTHTVSIFRHGIRSLIPENIRLLSGPGCPVCVTDQGDIDSIIKISRIPGVIIATYGDMMRVPGTCSSLLQRKGEGADIRVITSAMDCVALAENNPDREVVFLAIGFETTSPATASMIAEARDKGIRNLSITCFHKNTPPVLAQLAKDRELKIDGFLLPGHVSVILGYEPYRFLAEEHGIACSIAGFEPEDILLGIMDLTKQVKGRSPQLHSTYQRAVRPWGNKVARGLLNEVFKEADATWRGIGEIPLSGFRLRDELFHFDALSRFSIKTEKTPPPPGCRCGDVLSGRITPHECPLFANGCDPVHPVGPCMVSGEGTCSAYYKFNRGGRISWEN